MTKRALIREFLWLQWHQPAVTWPQFLRLTISDRYLMRSECNNLIKRHNEEAGVPPGDND